jgi:opacity protein-like surface antigen
MKNIVASLIAVAAIAAANADLIVSEVVDAPLPGGNPKYVEITNTGATDFTFGVGGIIVQSNASSDLDVDVDLSGVTIPAGVSYVIQSSANDGQFEFELTYGLIIGTDIAGQYTPAFFGNGDDRYIISNDGALLDIYGDIDTDGSGTAWEYTDSYAYRNPTAITGNGGAFVLSEWTIPGPNALETGDDVTERQLTAANTTPGTHVFVPEPASLILLALSALAIRRR